MRKRLRLLSVTALAAGLVFMLSVPATATIHEIVASYCAFSHEVPSPTGDIHDPPGLTPQHLGGTSSADNVAQPLLSSDALSVAEADGTNDFVQVGTGDPVPAGETLLVINEDKPQVKLLGSGVFFHDEPSDVWVEIGNPDPDFPAFQHCVNSLIDH